MELHPMEFLEMSHVVSIQVAAFISIPKRKLRVHIFGFRNCGIAVNFR